MLREESTAMASSSHPLDTPTHPSEIPPAAISAQPWTWRDLALLLGWLVLGLIVVFGTGVLVERTGVDAILVGYVATIGLYIWFLSGVFLRARPYGIRQALALRGIPLWTWIVLPGVFILQMIVAVTVNALALSFFPGFQNPQQGNMQELAGSTVFSPLQIGVLLLIIAVLAPIAEEFFFRGVLYPLVRRRMPLLAAIPLTALIFAVLHAIPQLIPALFIAGCIFTLAREYTGSILPGIVLHMLQNGLVVLLFAAQPYLLRLQEELQRQPPPF